MLIRSQDKTALIDISGTTIKVVEISSKKFNLIAYGNNNPSDAAETLGIYDNKKRTIEVLNEIQKSYTDTCSFAAVGGGFCIYDNKIFEMPEE